MFSLFGKKKETPKSNQPAPITPMLLALRQTLYTNSSLEPMLSRLKGDATANFPWSNFFKANEALKKNDNATAISLLKQITEAPDLEARIYLQAWHTLQSLGEKPSEETRAKIQGVVVEYYMPEHGLDIVAAFSDRSARYWNHSGTGVVWEKPDNSLDEAINLFLGAGQQVINSIGVEIREMLPPPQPGWIRIFVMAYGGSSFGQGLYDQISKDKMGNYAINAAFNLMTELMKKTPKK